MRNSTQNVQAQAENRLQPRNLSTIEKENTKVLENTTHGDVTSRSQYTVPVQDTGDLEHPSPQSTDRRQQEGVLTEVNNVDITSDPSVQDNNINTSFAEEQRNNPARAIALNMLLMLIKIMLRMAFGNFSRRWYFI